MIRKINLKFLTLILLILFSHKSYAQQVREIDVDRKTLDYTVNEDINFVITSPTTLLDDLIQSQEKIDEKQNLDLIDIGYGVQLPPPDVVIDTPDIYVLDGSSQKLDITELSLDTLSDGTGNVNVNSSINIKKDELKKPGKYKLVIEVDGNIYEQEFTWGVLAVNTNKSTYTLGDDAHFSMAVLNTEGNMVCDARLYLKISKNNRQVALLKTGEEITVNEVCNKHQYSEIPDYEARYKLSEVGKYEVELTAITSDSKYTIYDSFEVQKSPRFSVERIASTRIFPIEKYPVEIKVTANEDFAGVVVEKVPIEFEILNNPNAINYEEFENVGSYKLLKWRVDISKGEQIKLGYLYDSPDESPRLFTLGELELISDNETVYFETRLWQLAIDSVGAADATRLYTTGFELNSTTAGMEYDENVNTPVISSTTYRSGAYALNTALGADSTEGIGIQFVAADSQNAFTIRTYLRIATLPGATEEIIQILDTANTVHLSVRLTTAGVLQLYSNTSAAQVGSDSSALSTNTWYRVEMIVDSNVAGTSKMALRIDGVEVTGTRITNGSIGVVASSVAKVRIGILTSGQADLYWDDIAVNQDGYTNADHYPGEGKIVYLRPNGNGSDVAWAGDYTNVDDITPNDATGSDYINCTASGQLEDFTYQDSADVGIGANDYIKLMEGWLRNSASGTGARIHSLALVDSGGSDVGASTSVNSTSWFTNDDGTPRNSEIVSYDAQGAANYGPLTSTIVDGISTELSSTTDCTPQIRVTAIWIIVEYVPAEGGRIFSSGFELQSTTAGVEWSALAGTLAINTTTKRSGLSALEVASLASTTEESLAYHYTASGSDNVGPLFYRTYLYITTAPGAENRIIEVKNNAGTSMAYITLDGSRQLKLYDEDGAVGSVSSALAATTWYRIELKVEGSGGSDTVEAKIEGATFATTSASNLSSGTRTFLVGGNMNGEANTTGAWLFDDVAINKNAGSTQNSYPGYGRIAHLKPNANGSATAWTNAFGTNDEITPNDATGSDFISSSTINALETHNLENSSTYSIPSSATITLASTGIRFLNATAVSAAVVKVCGDSSCLSYIESGKLATSANTWYTNQTADPMSPPLTLYSETNETTALTTTALDALQLGVRLEVDGGTNTFSVSTLWMLVEYNDSITLAGTCDAFDQTTDCGDTGTIRFAVNGNLQFATQETVAGTWSITGVSAPATNDIITTFIDGASDSDEAVNVTKYDGTNGITGITLFKEHLVVGSGENQSMTNTNLGQYDNSVSGDEDIFHDVTSSNLVVDSTAQSSTEELYIDASDTYQPGGTLTTHDIEIDGTFTAEANALTISGSWDNDSNFSSTGTATFTATTGTETIDSTGSSTNSFHNLILGSGSGTATWNMSSALDINNDLTISYGTLAQNGSNNITLAGSLSIGASGNYTKSTGTFTFDGTTAETFTNTNSTITFDAASTGEIAPASSVYSWSHTVGSNNDRILVVGVGIRGNVAVSSVTYNGDNLTFAREEHPGGDVRTEVWYLLSPDTGSNTVTVTLASSQSSSAGAVSYYNVGGVISNAGDDDGGSADTASSVVLASETGQVVVDAISVQSSSNALRVGLNQTERVNYVGGHNAVGMSDEVGTLSTNSTWQFTSNYWAGVAISLRPAATLDNLGTVVFNKTDAVAPSTNNKVTLASSMVTDTVTINGTGGQADTLDLASSGYILEMKNAGSTADVLTNSGTLTIGTSTIKFSATNSGGNININNLPYSSLQVSGGETYVLTGNQTSSNAITGSLEIDYGATLDVTSTPYNITLEDNWSNWGTFTAQTGTVTIAGTGTSNIKGITSFNNFNSSTASKVIAFQSANTYSTPYTTFGGTVTLTGGSPANSANNISIQSDSSGTQWLANFSTTQSGSTYLKVQDSGCYSGTSDINLNSTSVDVSGNDSSCWIFGGLSADIVDSGGSPVASPNVALVTKSFQFTYQNGAGTLGLPSEKIRITNSTGSPAWSLSIAATGGPTAFWDGTSSDYDFNDGTSSAGDGADSDSLGGQLSINPTVGTSTPQGGCTNTGITFGSSTSFNEITPVNSITLVTAGGSADTNCYWDITDLAITQTIPSEQAPSTYSVDLTLTIL